MGDTGTMTPCEQFTVLASRQGTAVRQCDVCDHTEPAHASGGRRVLSGGEIEELRRRKLIEIFERGQAERGDGSDAPA